MWPKMVLLLAAAACASALLCAASPVGGAADESSARKVFDEETGRLLPEWENWSWNARWSAVPGAGGAILAEAKPWGGLQIAAVNRPISGDMVFSFSGMGELSSIALLMRDGQTWSKHATVDSELYEVLAPPDKDGWIRVHVSLADLVPDNPGLPVPPDPSTLTWEAIAAVDVSGVGYTAKIKDVAFLTPSEAEFAKIFETTFATEGTQAAMRNRTFIVRFKAPVAREVVSSFCESLEGGNGTGGTCDEMPEMFRAEGVEEGDLPPDTTTYQSVTGNIEEIRALASAQRATVEYIEEDQPASLFRCEERGGVVQGRIPWGQDRIDSPFLPLDFTFKYPGTGKGVSVYVLDTGLLPSHETFTRALVPPARGYNARQPSALPTDRAGHGTSVASLVAGWKYGVAKGATIVPVKVMGDDGSGFFSDILKGISWVLGQKKPGVPAVVNLSVGGPRSRALNDAVFDLASAGFSVLTSAGNSGADACSFSPASEPSIVSVGASTKEDKMPSFSNRGSCITLFAPGERLLAAGIKSDTASTLFTGTSASSPMAAGAAAIYLELYPNATQQEVKAALTDAAAGVLFDRTSPAKLLNIASFPVPVRPECVDDSAGFPPAPPQPAPPSAPPPPPPRTNRRGGLLRLFS